MKRRDVLALAGAGGAAGLAGCLSSIRGGDRPSFAADGFAKLDWYREESEQVAVHAVDPIMLPLDDFDEKQSRDFIDYDALRYTQEPVDFERHVHAPLPEFVEGDEAEWEEGDAQFRGGVSFIMDEADLDHLSFDVLTNQDEAETFVDTTDFAREMLLLYVIERHTVAPEDEEIHIGWLDDGHLYVEAVVRHNMMMWPSTYVAAARVEPFVPPATITRALRNVSGPRYASISVDTDLVSRP